MCENGVQLLKQSVYSPMPPLSVKTGPCPHQKLTAVQLHWLWKFYDDTVAMVTWATPLLSFPAGTFWADPFLWIGVCSAAPTQNRKLLWFLLWFLLWWYVPDDLLNAVCYDSVHSFSNYFSQHWKFPLSQFHLHMFYSFVLSLDFYCWWFYWASSLGLCPPWRKMDYFLWYLAPLTCHP